VRQVARANLVPAMPIHPSAHVREYTSQATP
jgi:hypothetical protein